MVEKLVKKSEEVKSLKELLERKEIEEEKPETILVEIEKWTKSRTGSIILLGKVNVDGVEQKIAINTKFIDIEKVKVKKINNKYYLEILRRAYDRAMQNPLPFRNEYLLIPIRETDLPPE